MLEFCRRKHGKVMTFLLVFLLLISIPAAGGNATRERVKRLATAVLSQIDGSASLFCTMEPAEPRAAEVRPANPSCPLMAAYRPEFEPQMSEKETAGGFIHPVILLYLAAACAACILPRGRVSFYHTIPRRSRADERYRRLFSGNNPPALT